MYISQNIKYLRFTRGISQVRLARMLGVVQSNVWKYENEKLTPPLDIIVKLSNIFEVSIDSLVSENLKTANDTKP